MTLKLGILSKLVTEPAGAYGGAKEVQVVVVVSNLKIWSGLLRKVEVYPTFVSSGSTSRQPPKSEKLTTWMIARFESPTQARAPPPTARRSFAFKNLMLWILFIPEPKRFEMYAPGLEMLILKKSHGEISN